MRIPVIAGNWKLYKKTAEALQLVQDLSSLVKDVKGVEIVVAPSFTVLGPVRSLLFDSPIAVAGQDCFWAEEGAYTGEVSPGMLVDAGCSHVIIGHSERRQLFAETDEKVNKKITAALRAGLTVLFCVGETLHEREAGETFAVLDRQIRTGLNNLSPVDMEKVILAYEPVWAIGTGKTATDEQAQEAHAFIRQLVAELFSSGVADALRIVYGGSVKPDNITALMAQPDVDGALVGGASLTAESFAAIIRFQK
ncbi:MAG: triose-phosphate isomerase [Deltaproteobacteria bacterium]|nr:triose-phosphate isomerase [Deltaproteobacteria bacterium]TLN03742.1 MAG: triose-phosphate isomerase [bacterium]